MPNLKVAVRIVINGTLELGGGDKTREELESAAKAMVERRLEDNPPCQMGEVEIEIVGSTGLED